MKEAKKAKSENKAIQAMKKASEIAMENGIADMTIDEINAEINKTRNYAETC